MASRFALPFARVDGGAPLAAVWPDSKRTARYGADNENSGLRVSFAPRSGPDGRRHSHPGHEPCRIDGPCQHRAGQWLMESSAPGEGCGARVRREAPLSISHLFLYTRIIPASPCPAVSRRPTFAEFPAANFEFSTSALRHSWLAAARRRRPIERTRLAQTPLNSTVHWYPAGHRRARYAHRRFAHVGDAARHSRPSRHRSCAARAARIGSGALAPPRSGTSYRAAGRV